MLKKWTCSLCAVLVVGLIGNPTVVRATDWTGVAGDGNWMNPANWSPILPVAGERVDIENGTPITWPVLDGGTVDCGQVRIAYVGNSVGELTVTGGATLNIAGELRLGRQESVPTPAGYLYISGDGTTINVTNLIECGRHGKGIIVMSGGYLHSDAHLRMAYRFDGSAEIHLNGGTIDLGGNPGITAYANDGIPGTALIDISGGIITLAGNQVSLIETFISEGIIIGYGGEGTVSATFDGLTTTVAATGGPSTSKPDPASESTDVPRDAVLSWKAGAFAPAVNGHKLYFSENFTDVNDGIGGMIQDANSYAPPQLLAFGKTYHWRVDELSAPPDSTVFKGEVWQFTVEPFAYPVAGNNIIATASSSNSVADGPENTINDSGLDPDDLHSTNSAAMWLSSIIDPNAAWIQYELDRVYALHQMLVWNHNTSTEPVIGYGIRDATVEHSVDAANWNTLGTTHEFARGPGLAGYPANTTVGLGGLPAKYVKITANSNWGNILAQYGLSEVRFLNVPVFAKEPSPDPGETDVDVNVTLRWRAGRGAAGHDVYLSTDERALIDGDAAPATTVTDPSYSTPPLDLGSTYYWRVDEVNEAETPTTWQGDVWDFTTQDYLVVEDFESYNDIEAGQEGSNLVYLTWVDGFDNPSANGSTIGYTEAFQPSMETSLVYDGTQSVPFFYNNAVAASSEVTANVADLQVGQDWTKHGIKALILQFHGDPNNSVNDQMYVKVSGSKVAYDGDADNLMRASWQTWYIDLASVGVSLSNVTSLGIGLQRVGAFGGQGVVYLDGIRLYAHARQVITPADPGTTGLQAHYEFEGNTNDSSGNARRGTAMGNPTFVAGKVGQATHLRGLDYVVITGYKGILGANPFSISAWIKTSLPEEQQIILYGTDAGGQRCEFRVDDSGDVRIGNGAGQVTSLTTVNDGGWHHVVATISENATNSSLDVRIYVDGQDDTAESTDADAFDIVADWDVAIGYRSSRDDRGFQGELDDVRIYDRALSPEEAAWLAGRTKAFDKPF